MKKILILILLVFCFCACPVFAKSEYEQIDKYAFKAPPLKKTEDLDQLVRYLVKPYNTEKEKARVILAWIVYNVDYDKFKSNAISGKIASGVKKIPHNDILKTRIGVCEDIAKLYQTMGKMADLEIQLVYGKTRKKKTVEEFDAALGHVWNVVKIDGEWEYVDPTWALDGDGTAVLNNVTKEKKYKKIVEQREKHASKAKHRLRRMVKDKWFLTNKDEMIKSHFPMKEEWQLQEKKITKEEFLGLSPPKESQTKEEKKETKKDPS